MDNTLQTSFIPKKPISPNIERGPRKAVGFVGLIATIIFIISIAIGGGVFGYKKILESQKASKKENLERAREAFSPATIKELRRVDKRLLVASTLLGNHVAPTAVFDFLSRSTLKSVKFDTFTFTGNADDEGLMKITLLGRARNYASVALQADEFGVMPELRQPIISNLNLDERGNVIFTVNAFVDPKFLSYKSVVSKVLGGNDEVPEEVSIPIEEGTKPSAPTPTVNPSQNSGSGSIKSGSQVSPPAQSSGSSNQSQNQTGGASSPGPSNNDLVIPDDEFEDFEAL